MALGLTQPLTEMSTRNISCGGKGGRCVGLTTLPPSCADCLEICVLQPPGTLRAVMGLLAKNEVRNVYVTRITLQLYFAVALNFLLLLYLL